MLQSLHVKNLALIDEIEVEFKDGLNILTGETGAGKSIILGSINLALGGRYSKDILRPGADYGFVEISFSADKEYQLQKLLLLDIYPEDGVITLSRRIMPGRSVSRINGETVQMSLLREVSALLIDIHGQHEHQSLLYKKNHLIITDRFAGDQVLEQKEEVGKEYRCYMEYKKELEKALLDEGERAKELSYLQFVVKEIKQAGLRVGEDEELEEIYQKMVCSRKILEGIDETHRYTGEGTENASEYLTRGIRILGDLVKYDEYLKTLYEQLGEIDSLLNDFNRELSEYEKTCEFSDEDYYETENRLNEINHLKTKYGDSIEDVLEECKKQEERIAILEDYDQYLMKLRRNMEDSEAKLHASSKRLSEYRKNHARVLEKEIETALKDLNFEQVVFQISFKNTAGYTADGIDDVEFLISLNPGQPPKPLGDVASGGELSRIMLAIKAVMAKKDEIETLIFDEIDVGISGRTAQKVSEKMALISEGHQVICITHLAQIAAMADHHYRIEKKTDNNTAKTYIIPLNESESVEELTRILGGAQITPTVKKSAQEMKRLAKEYRAEYRHSE